MRIESIYIENVPPVQKFEANELSDTVVLAGANGVGKTRLIEGIVGFVQSLGPRSNIRLVFNATCETEKAKWGKSILDTKDANDINKLKETLQQNRKRSSWQSSFIRFESDRSIQQIQPYNFNWDFADPFEENAGWSTTLNYLRSRFQETLHSLFRKVRSHRESIARKAVELRTAGATSMPLDWQDPLATFKTAFYQLLAPKTLIDPDPQRQHLEYMLNGVRYPIDTLSSGEREVVNIVFDFLLRNPEDCVVLFDEPELHLHPELSYRLLQTLRIIGKRNQFIFCTHSPDIITAALDQTVLFVGPPKEPIINQAIAVKPEDETNQALQLLGQSIGIIALGKRLVLIEGISSSLDKQTYGMILKNRFPGLVLVPTGGKGLVTSFDKILSNVLERSIWGVQFFMLCDGDTLPVSTVTSSIELRSNGRLKILSRYHLENYFLDEHILASVFSHMEPPESLLRNPDEINKKLRELAQKHSSYATALIVAADLRTRVGNVDLLPNDVQARQPEELTRLFLQIATTEKKRVETILSESEISNRVSSTAAMVAASLTSPDCDWKRLIPGRPIFNSFAAMTKLGPSRLKQMYLAEVEVQAKDTFKEIIDIFSEFEKSS